MKRLAPAFVSALAVASVAGAARAEDFTYAPPGELVPGSGDGRVDNNVYAPAMRFPIEAAPAFANSQVWGVGGSQGPGGSQCDVANFSYPWHDNYCETRSWDMPLCPSGTGHQGQDIRAATCDKDVHWVVAAEAGTVTNVGSYSVYITAPDGTRYDYLHMGSVQVAVGDDVAKGEHIGKVSNEFGGTPTSVHLHFNLRQDVASVGNVYVPPYLSLVTSYQALIGPPVEPAQGSLDAASCETLGGWAASPSDPETAIEALLYFDGERGDGASIGHPVLADYAREACGAAGACNNGFVIGPPLALFDGLEHTVRAYASDGTQNAPELGASPQPLQCSFTMPSGVRRKVADADAANAWHFSSFWDEIGVSTGILGSIAEGPALDARPRVVRSTAADSKLWLVDRGVRRAAADVRTARAWDMAALTAEELTDAELAAIPEGLPLRPRPVVLRGPDGGLWLVDDAMVEVASPGPDPADPAGADDANADVEASCSCNAPGSQPSSRGLLFAALAAIPAVLRRRRRSS